MQFSEHEMTVAVDAAARHLFSARQLPWRRGKAENKWANLDRFAQYQHRAAAGEMVLPTLSALPERDAIGRKPSFSQDELALAAEQGAQQLLDHRTPGAWEKLSPKRRKAVVHVTALVTSIALDAMPVRPDPEADFVVPDHIGE